MQESLHLTCSPDGNSTNPQIRTQEQLWYRGPDHTQDLQQGLAPGLALALAEPPAFTILTRSVRKHPVPTPYSECKM